MGINYYSVKRCTHCGHSDILHIGKSSHGWCFALATHGAPTGGIAGLHSLEDWQRFLRESTDRVIEDEYCRLVTYDKLMSVITDRKYRDGPPQRSTIDGTYCIGHGPGTWDLMAGDFH